MNRSEWERWLREAPEAARFRQKGIDGEGRARHAAAVRNNWKDPNFRARHAAAVREGTARYWKRRAVSGDGA